MKILVLKKGKQTSSAIHPGTRGILTHSPKLSNTFLRLEWNEIVQAKTDDLFKEFAKFDSYFTNHNHNQEQGA